MSTNLLNIYFNSMCCFITSNNLWMIFFMQRNELINYVCFALEKYGLLLHSNALPADVWIFVIKINCLKLRGKSLKHFSFHRQHKSNITCYSIVTLILYIYCFFISLTKSLERRCNWNRKLMNDSRRTSWLNWKTFSNFAIIWSW